MIGTPEPCTTKHILPSERPTGVVSPITRVGEQIVQNRVGTQWTARTILLRPKLLWPMLLILWLNTAENNHFHSNSSNHNLIFTLTLHFQKDLD